MKNLHSKLIAGALLIASFFGFSVKSHAIGWPENYEGVMLQGFYWDSYTDTKWTNLESQADELSKYFKLIWVPNSGKCSYMGYMPQYWFTNHNSAFGTENELLSMIQTFKAKGTGFIADCVINHRNGVTNWYDFPVEQWNGKTWKIGLEGICSDDEMSKNSNQPKPTGNRDTGENFDGCRDLDHTNANVQDNCKNYVKCLQEKYGYAGMRYDMVKGYGGQYTKIYNQYANVQYSVGEYWDGNYDKVAAWIEATGKTSAAFDFPCKYAINEAFHSNDMRKLVWKANGTTDQPAGLIHFGYPRYAVTFIDNHDTYKDGSKFNGNVVAANAFILMSPGTPCVFLPHYKDYKSQIQKLIEIRNAAGLHNMSHVTVLRCDQDCYMAEVTGTKGKVVVKIGNAMVSPSGYSDSDIKASGNGYCVWTKAGGVTPTPTPTPTPGTAPAHLYLLGNLSTCSWDTSASPEMTKNGDKFTITATFKPAASEEYCFFNFSDALGSNWDELNANANRYGASTEGTIVSNNSKSQITTYANGVDASGAKSWKILPGTYTLTADFSNMTLTIGQGGGNQDDPLPDMPAHFYILGHTEGKDWGFDKGFELVKIGNSFTASVNFSGPASQTDGYAYFSFAKNLASSWDDLNVSGNRYAPSVDTEITPDGPAVSLTEAPADAKAFKVKTGTYTIDVNWKNKTVHLKNNSGTLINEIEETDASPEYYTLQGIKVTTPVKGSLYIRVINGKAKKVIF